MRGNKNESFFQTNKNSYSQNKQVPGNLFQKNKNERLHLIIQKFSAKYTSPKKFSKASKAHVVPDVELTFFSSPLTTQIWSICIRKTCSLTRWVSGNNKVSPVWLEVIFIIFNLINIMCGGYACSQPKKTQNSLRLRRTGRTKAYLACVWLFVCDFFIKSFIHSFSHRDIVDGINEAFFASLPCDQETHLYSLKKHFNVLRNNVACYER